MSSTISLYAIALGSNRRHVRYGQPEGVLRAALAAMTEIGAVTRVSRIHATPALGPAGRSFANAAMILSTDLPPPDLLRRLKQMERRFGRRPGRRWGPRVLDLDILLWSGGAYGSRQLLIPHPQMLRRAFVLLPLSEVAGNWPVPRARRDVRHAAAVLNRRGRHGSHAVDP